MIPTTRHIEKNFTNNMVVVESKVNLEREIESNVQRIQTLIKRLNPSERQKYFNGLLSFIVSNQTTPQTVSNDADYSGLSENDLGILSEMSDKLQELYNVLGDVE